ncbi:YdcF family protein [Mucilaginibacter aquaedulcis]|uniref:YdcF family protein n=1 Tax=Mucilaginibacter aquaedulcis TaxID=1187081 RepID=UPI0025B4574B|nr:YdcF family protein [Mucilaginibacter aquaedulcis]MDN3547990.1 YdcF family protein [Mucilaginibacter aquaedulcis]
MNFKKYLIVLFCLTTLYSYGQAPDPQYKLVGSNFIQTKNYYLLTLFQSNVAAKQMLSNDPELVKLTRTRLENIKASLTTCKDVSCFTQTIKFTDDEIKAVSERLTNLYKPDNALGNLVKLDLIPSGTYILYKDLSPVQLLVKAWEQDAKAVNYTIEVYAEGRKPNYPLIDSIAFNVKSRSYLNLVYDASATIYDEDKKEKLFFTPSMNYALQCLEINEREDAANDEPMVLKVNKNAFNRIKTIKWGDYKYTMILIPGAGPDVDGVALSAEGMLRCRVAALRYFEGLAPFIMTSGGKVHPYKTKFCEADEMKKYMVEKLHVPENAIFVDPHARHTTTNMRNCVRIIFRYGMPFSKPCITSTDKYQSYFIENMAGRCQKELGYVPYILGKRLSDTEQEFYPVITSLQIDADEPLDP